MLKINFKSIFRAVPVSCMLLMLVLTGVVACNQADIISQAPASWRGWISMTREVKGVGKYVYSTKDVIFIQKADQETGDLYGGTAYEILSGTMAMAIDLSYGCTRKGYTEYALAKNEGTLITNRSSRANSFYTGDISLTHPVMITTHCGPPFPDLTAPEDTNDFIRIDSRPANDNVPRADGHLMGVTELDDGNTKITVAWDLTPVN
jgi:hypothetical protein